MPDNRKNLQVKQSGIEGYDVADGTGWPTPLSSPLNPLKLVVSDGSRGETRDFRAMATDGQNELSLPEGKNSVGGKKFDEATVDVKKTVGNSLS